MERMKQFSWLTGVLISLFFISGCAYQTHALKKQQMVQEWDKSTAQAKLTMVRDLLDRDQIQEAKKIIAECRNVDPDNPESCFLAARVQIAEGRNEAAMQSLQKSVELDQQQDEAWFALGILYQEQNQYDRALVCYRKALELQPAKIDYILGLVHLYSMEGDEKQALQLLEEKRKILPNRQELIIASADLAQRNGNPEEAIRLYKEAILQQGDNPQLLEALGICYLGQQQWKQAADVFEKQLELVDDQQKEHVLHWLALCLLQDGQYGKALTYYDRLSVLRREDPQVWLEMGQAALGAELPDRARYCGQKALRLQPAWMDAEVVIGGSLYMEKNYTRALQIFRRVGDDSQWEAFGYWMAGRCYQKLGNTALARSAFEKASKLSPDSPMTQMFMREMNSSL